MSESESENDGVEYVAGTRYVAPSAWPMAAYINEGCLYVHPDLMRGFVLLAEAAASMAEAIHDSTAEDAVDATEGTEPCGS